MEIEGFEVLDKDHNPLSVLLKKKKRTRIIPSGFSYFESNLFTIHIPTSFGFGFLFQNKSIDYTLSVGKIEKKID